jgi:hypothetical protein
MVTIDFCIHAYIYPSYEKQIRLAILLLTGAAAKSQSLLFTSEFGGANSRGPW